MKKMVFVLLMIFLIGTFLRSASADREISTITAYTSDTLVKRGDWKIYRVTYVATANGGFFSIHDSLTSSGTSNTNVKTEGSEASAKNGKILDFTCKPLEGSTGLYLVVSNAQVVIEYE